MAVLGHVLLHLTLVSRTLRARETGRRISSAAPLWSSVANAMNELLVTLGFVPFFAQQLSNLSVRENRLGRVVSVQRSVIGVACSDQRRSVELSINLQQAEPIDRPTVGDWVILDETRTRIEQGLERKSLFKRIGSGNTTQFQPIAANIDVVFIVTSCNDEFKESRLHGKPRRISSSDRRADRWRTLGDRSRI